MNTVGYSGTPLWKKLGYKSNMRVLVLSAPAHYKQILSGGLQDWTYVQRGADAIHVFISEIRELTEIQRLAQLLPPAKMLWVSWPKKTSPLSKGLSEDHIRSTALSCGLVDIKVCAVDKDWSGLKLTRRRV
jgi:hypothetical protein